MLLGFFVSKIADQISYLSDQDLSLLYIAARKLLKNRGILDRVVKVIAKEFPYHSIINGKRESLPKHIDGCFSRKGIRKNKDESILFDFLDDDWSSLFDSNYDEDRKYYVYYHTNPNFKDTVFISGESKIVFKGKPFYVGKGTGNRFNSKIRSRSHISVLNKIESVYSKIDIYHIFKENLTEKEAFELESKLITFFGCESEIGKNKMHFHGYNGGFLINADPAKRPEYVSKMINVRGLSNKD